jgi:hypothetical protein
MTLIVEDGTGLPNAESYISVASASIYFSARGNTLWPSDVPTCEAALRLATDYMLGLYRMRWDGFRTSQTQALDWPRSFVPRPDLVGGYYGYPNYYATNVVPIEVQQACAELALRYIVNGDLAPDIAHEDVTTSVKVGPIEIQYAPGASPLVTFTAVNRKLAPFFGTGGTKAVR